MLACLTPNWPISLQIHAGLTILGASRLKGLYRGGARGASGGGGAHTQDTKNSLDFVLLTLHALDVHTLRKSYKAGLEVDLLQRQSVIVVH